MWASVCGAIVGLSLMLMSANREAAPAAAPTVFLTRQERQVGDVVAVMTVANVFALLLLVTDRYWTSVSIGAALIALLWAGNRLKVAILNEVLVFSDIFLAGHALRYPRLYFGYAPKWVWPVVIAGGAALGWCLTIEAPMNVLTDGERLGFVGLWLGGGGLMVVRMAKPSGRIKSFPVALSHEFRYADRCLGLYAVGSRFAACSSARTVSSCPSRAFCEDQRGECAIVRRQAHAGTWASSPHSSRILCAHRRAA